MEIDVQDPGATPSTAAASKAERRLIFISHANPEDNVFAEWLATQLAIAGYEVWCDVTELLGGEKFWTDISEAIDHYAFRVLFVSTLEGNRKPGTLRELQLARVAQQREELKDFIVPLKIDSLPFGAMEKGLRDLNIMRFDQGWAAGLARLLDLLEREGAPRSTTAGADCVSDWYRKSLDTTRKSYVTDDRHVSNWFRLDLPTWVYFHRFRGVAEQLPTVAELHPYAYRLHGAHLISFSASPVGCADSFDANKVVKVKTHEFLGNGSNVLGIQSQDAANIVTDLVRQAWEAEMRTRDFCSYTMSGQLAWFFRKGALKKERLYFGDRKTAGRRSYRQVVGIKSKRTAAGKPVPDGHWHYAISGTPQLLPFPRMVLKHHVVFTDDGQTPWDNADRMHRARRKVCKNWWNPHWRDRLLAVCEYLGDGTEVLTLPVGADEAVEMEVAPMTFVSPWRYFEDNETGLDESVDIVLVEDVDDVDEDDDRFEKGDDDEQG